MSLNLRFELQQIFEDRGVLNPAVLLDVARDENHPLHDRFEWNDTEAAERFRLIQAGNIIRSVRVRFTSQKEDRRTVSVRAWQPVREDSGRIVYEPTQSFARDPLRVQVALADMERDWRNLRRRWERMQEFWELVRREADAELPAVKK